jgi:predicted nucleic acid-binding protein
VDTSCLVAALLQQHPKHADAFRLLKDIRSGAREGFLATHGLAELFATLTALPLTPRLSPAQVESLLERSVHPHFTLVELTAAHYREALRMTVLQNLPSGAIYDALHVIGARSAHCSQLYTLNLRHFRLLAPGDPLICSP